MGIKQSLMGTNQHSTHIYNNTQTRIAVVVIFSGDEQAGAGSTRVNLEPEDIKCVRTGHGEVMIRAYVNTTDNKRGHVVHTDESNRYYFIKNKKNCFVVPNIIEVLLINI